VLDGVLRVDSEDEGGRKRRAAVADERESISSSPSKTPLAFLCIPRRNHLYKTRLVVVLVAVVGRDRV
jgi:hypothetical protein